MPRQTYLVVSIKICFRVFDTVFRIIYLALEIVPIFFQLANWILNEWLNIVVTVAYILGCVDENINSLVQELRVRYNDKRKQKNNNKHKCCGRQRENKWMRLKI